MSSKKKTTEKKSKSPKDYRTAAEVSFAQAQTLAGEKVMSDEEFIVSMSKSDDLADHPDAWTETGTCGHCGMMICWAETARDMLKAGDTGPGAIGRWSDESRKRWEAGKYFQLYQTEKAAGRDPHKAFEDRKWEM